MNIYTYIYMHTYKTGSVQRGGNKGTVKEKEYNRQIISILYKRHFYIRAKITSTGQYSNLLKRNEPSFLSFSTFLSNSNPVSNKLQLN